MKPPAKVSIDLGARVGGGTAVLDPYDLGYLRRVGAPEHFSILAQIGPFELIDAATFPSRAVRLIG